VSRFSHSTFAARVADPSRDEYKRTVCIVCQRWFCKIKNPDPKSKFYNTFQKPKCYFLWLGDRADTPQAQAEFLAAPYQGEGGLKNGWRRKDHATCSRCGNAAQSAEAQAKHENAVNKPSNKCINFATTGCTKKATGSKRPCPDCKAEQKRRAAIAGAGSSTDPPPST